MYIAQHHTQQLPYLSSAHSVLSTSATVYCWQCVAMYITSLSYSKQFQTTVHHYIILYIYPFNKCDSLLNTGHQWCNINHLLSIDEMGNSSNPVIDFIALSCPVWHTHTHSQYINTNIITTIYIILSPYLALSDTYTHTHTVSEQTQILLLQST